MSLEYPAPWNGELLQYFTELNSVMKTVGHLYLNIYTDASGTIIANDSAGNPIQHRLVNYMMYTYSQNDVSWSQAAIGSFRIVFDDNTSITLFDNNPILYYYTIDGIVPVVVKPLT